MKTQAAAIEFGTSKVVTVFAESGGFARCEIIGSGTVYYDGYKGGVWNRPDLLAEAVRNSINAAELEAKTRIHSVYVGVPCEYIQIRVAEAEVAINSADERVGDDQINAVQDAAADKLRLADVQATVIHRSPAWFSVDGGKHTMSILGVRGKRLRASVSFILADPAFMEDICELLSMLGITVMGFMAPVLGQTLLMLPQTYMNLSGEAVGEAARFYKVPPGRVIVVSDEMALPPGVIRVRPGGSAGGHNGLKSIIAALGTEQFPRIRLGVGEPPHPDYDTADWVLGRFAGEDVKLMEDAAARAAQAVRSYITDGAEKTMGRFNQKHAGPSHH